MNDIEDKLLDLFSSIQTDRTILSPSQYAEKYRSLTSDVSTIKGKFNYNITPYTREIVDTLSQFHPAKIIGIMKGAQSGLTEGLVVNGTLWKIANNPGNILLLSADDELSKEIITGRLDQGIQSCGIQHLIRPNTIRKRNQRTGDTDRHKEFSGGHLFAGSIGSVVKYSHQRSLQTVFLDDWDKAPVLDKVEGSLFELIQLRLSTSSKTMKQYYISTPKTRPSNIENVYLLGDQRKYLLPCPKCGDFIEIFWSGTVGKDHVGVYFEKDSLGKLIEKSVGYVCQSCGAFFKETNKYEMNLNGNWKAFAEPSMEGFYSYQMNNLIGAPHMFNWNDYAKQWLRIWKDGNESISKRKVFRNQVEGLPWEETKMDIKKNRLIKNTRKYSVGEIPNKQSKDDGNGNILLITCACDLNGPIDDARLDYDVWGWAENGSVYSIDQGSIGTFQSYSKNDDREKLTYKNEQANNVWDIFYNDVINRTFYTDEGDERKIMIVGVDTGYAEHFAFTFINDHPKLVYGIKGGSDGKFHKYDRNVPVFKKGKTRPNLFILDPNVLKDQLAEMINLHWNEENMQPPGFMNFPVPTAEKYTPKYFVQYEAEHKILEENEEGEAIGWKWDKIKSTAQNHFFDTAYYNLALRDIFANNVCKEIKMVDGIDIKDEGFAGYVLAVKSIAGL